jgi:DNA-binding transcriptional regulator YhcF (GntR family)
MQRNKMIIVISLLALVILVGGIFSTLNVFGVEKDDDGLKRRCKVPNPWMYDLTDEQRQEIRDLLEELRESGATIEEVKEAIDLKLTEWGIEIPNKGMRQRQPWMPELTDEQREEIKQLIEELKESGASREEIKEAVDAKLVEWNIEIPEGKMPSHPPWLLELTDEQKEEIREIVEELKDNGATKEEIKEAVDSKLEEWGIEASNKGMGQRPPWMPELTDEQKEEIKDLVEEMRDSGATKEEIKEAIGLKLEKWGIEIPDKPIPPHQ